MLLAVVDTSTPAITAAVVRLAQPVAGGGPLPERARVRVLAQRVTVDARAHGELLAAHLDAVLREAGLRPADLTAVVAGLGPGPFTGLRVGLVTAASLGQALDIPTYGVCSLDALGLAAAADGTVLVATDARRHEVYWATYTAGVRLAGPGVARPDELTVAAEVTVTVGDGALRYAGRVRDQTGEPLPVRDEPRYPPAWALAALAAGRVADGAPTEGLVPLYLRRPDAVEPGVRKQVLP